MHISLSKCSGGVRLKVMDTFKCVSVSNNPSRSFKPGLVRSLGNLYSLDDFIDEDRNASTPSYPSSPPPALFSASSLLPSGPPPPRFGFGYPVRQEVNNNLNNPPAPALRPAMRGGFRPNPRVPVPGVLTGRHLSRSVPVSGFSDFSSKHVSFPFYVWILTFFGSFVNFSLLLLNKSAFLLLSSHPPTFVFHLSCFFLLLIFVFYFLHTLQPHASAKQIPAFIIFYLHKMSVSLFLSV